MSFPMRPSLPLRLSRLTFSLLAFAMGALLLPSQGHASCTTTSNVTTCTGGGITLSSSLNTSVGSSISVTGVSGTVTAISVTFNGLNVTGGGGVNSIAAVLVSPAAALDLFSGVCNVGNSTFTLADSGINGTDAADGLAPYEGSGATCPSALSGTYLPSDWFPDEDVFNSPGPSSYKSGGASNACSSYSGGPCGTDNFTSTFGLPTASDINDTWTLYIANQGTPAGTGSLGSWSISFTTETATSTTTSLSASPNGSSSLVFTNKDVNGDTTAGTSVTLTATVTPPPDGGTVTFYDSTGTSPGSGTQLGSPVAVSGDQAQANVTLSTEGSRTISAVFSGIPSTYATSTSNVATVLTTNHPYNPPGTTTFCNGPITLNNNPAETASGGASTPYPSLMALSASQLTGTIESVTVSLNNVSLPDFDGVENAELDTLGFLLQAPGNETSGLGSNGNAFEFLSWAGNPFASGSLTFSDTGTAEIPYDSSPSCSTCLPTDNWVDIAAGDDIDTFPSPAPGSFDKAAPTGSSTFATEFGGQGANYTWSLYSADRISHNPPLGTIGSWCLNFTMQVGANATTTTVSSSANPASFSSGSTASVTLTASVASGGGTVDAGTVTFDDGSTELGSTTVSGGVATLNNVNLTEGTHQVVASYGGTNSGTVFGISSGKLDVRVNKATSTPTLTGGNKYSYCNTGAIIAPGLNDDSGAAYPYPSNIFVTNLPGTVEATSLTLNGFSTKDQADLMSLVVGPSTNSNAWNNNFEFFSMTGSSAGSPPTLNVTFADGGSSIGGNLGSSSTYAPTDFNNNVANFPQCPPNATDCGTENVGPPLGSSSTFNSTNKASTVGSSVFGDASQAGVFGGTSSSTYNGNGTWSLYLDDGGPNGGGEDTNVTQGWCVNLTENPVTITPALGHDGTGLNTDFVQGEQSAPITVAVAIAGNTGPTGDPTGTNPFTVVDTLPAGLTYASASGTDWSCNPSGQTVTCTNHDPEAAGASYPTLTLDVNVASGATGSLQNSISVSGAGVATSTNPTTDNITVDPAAVLGIGVSHTGTFTQGQTGQWNIQVSNTATGGITYGTVTVNDVLPTGYTLASYSGTGWTCTGVTTQTANCTTTQGVDGGANFMLLTLTVNIPANSPTSVSNTAFAYGGGDLTHYQLSNAISATDSNVTVVQVPATIAINGTQTQSTPDGSSFGSLAVTVEDGGGVVIPNYSSVTFTAGMGGGGASGTFSNSTNTISVSANPAGVADPGSFTANNNTGSYSVTVTAGSATTSFNLTNTAITPTFNWSPVTEIFNGEPGNNVLNATMSCGACGTITYYAIPNIGGPTKITNTSGLAPGSYTIQAQFAPGSSEYNPTNTSSPFTVTLAATMTSPTPGSVLGDAVTFNWTSVSGADYVLHLGTTKGGNDLRGSGTIAASSVSFSGLPINGAVIYARLYTIIGNDYRYIDYVYTGATPVAITSPAPGSVLTGPTVQFNWGTANGATGYVLHLGTTLGGQDLRGTGPSTANTITFSGLPTNGETIYARLYTNFATGAAYNDYTYTASSPAALTSPTPSAVLNDTSVMFNWTAGSGTGNSYVLNLGTTKGGNDLRGTGTISGNSVSFNGLPSNGQTIYARLYTYFATGGYAFNDYTYTAVTPGMVTSPAANSTLSAGPVTFNWTTVTGATGYVLHLGSTPGGNDIHGTGVITANSATFNILPTGGQPIYARLYTYFASGASAYVDYVYTAAP